MKLISYFLYFPLGVGTAWIFLLFQHWSVWRVDPAYPNRSKWLIVGGAIIRWSLIAVALTAALVNSITAALIVFTAFMTTRTFLLMRWQKSPQIRENQF